jgi:outer membrane protein assembly factor BamB
MRRLHLLFLVAACSSNRSSPADNLSCGNGTQQVGDLCVPIDAAPGDAPPADAGPDAAIDAQPDAPADARGPDAPWPDAAIQPDESTAFAIDPAHDNLQPTDTVHSPLTPLWTATFPGHISYPLVVGGLVIVSAYGTPSTIRALGVTTGALAWGPIATDGVNQLAYDAGRIFALDANGHLTAWDLATGYHVWTIQILGESFFNGPPVASNGVIYVNGTGSAGKTFAFDEQTGAMLWQQSTIDGSHGCVAVAGGTVYEAESCDDMWAWNALTGAQQWTHAGGCTGGGGTAPSVYSGQIWQRDLSGGNVIYNASGTPVGTFAGTAAPAFHAGTAFYQASGRLKAVDLATNTVRWTFAGDSQLCTSPVVAGAGGQVFVASSLGHVYEVDEVTGTQRSVHTIAGSITCFSETDTITIAEGHLLVPTSTSLVVY